MEPILFAALTIIAQKHFVIAHKCSDAGQQIRRPYLFMLSCNFNQLKKGGYLSFLYS